MVGKLEDRLLEMLMQNKCTCCGKKQEVGKPFYEDEPNQYLCEDCNSKTRCKACNCPVLNKKKLCHECGRKWQ